MATDCIVVRGIVRNGLVVPQTEAVLPEGLQVEIVLSPADVSPELREDFDLWERASDEAWAMIDQWEKEP